MPYLLRWFTVDLIIAEELLIVVLINGFFEFASTSLFLLLRFDSFISTLPFNLDPFSGSL